MCIGLGLAGLGFLEYSISRELTKIGIKTEARVVDIMEYKDGNSNATGVHRSDIEYKLVYEYIDRSGSRVRFKSKYRSKFHDGEIGDIVKIIYHPNNITQRVDSFWNLYFDPIIYWAMGLIACIFGSRIIRRFKYDS